MKTSAAFSTIVNQKGTGTTATASGKSRRDLNQLSQLSIHNQTNVTGNRALFAASAAANRNHSSNEHSQERFEKTAAQMHPGMKASHSSTDLKGPVGAQFHSKPGKNNKNRQANSS